MKNSIETLKSITILQARTSSSRLPAKVLLPIGGVPMALLAARRAANTGRKVIVATSHHQTDDVLCQLLAQNDISHYRGSLDNVLKRFTDCLKDYNDESIVVRLTADNVLPDGPLIDEMEAQFLEHKPEYLKCENNSSGLPFGISVEITKLKYLREAMLFSTTARQKEHVTTYIAEKYGTRFFTKYNSLNKGEQRCTVDNLSDYLFVANLFNRVTNPVNVSFLTILDKIQEVKATTLRPSSKRRLIFGAAQLGLNYGIANKSGMPDQEAINILLEKAFQGGAEFVDTARSYGRSEEAIGNYLATRNGEKLKIITKLGILDNCPENASNAVVDAFVDQSVFQSCYRLQTKNFSVLMLHRVTHLNSWNGQVLNRVLELHKEGLFNSLGVSVQTPEELILAIQCSHIEYIQLPFNILDWRWHEVLGLLNKSKNERKIKIHVRSVLLQGLLTSSDDRLWAKANVENSHDIIKWLVKQVLICGRENVVDLCIAYALGHSWIDGICLGMESEDQLLLNMRLVDIDPLTCSQIDFINNCRPKLDMKALDPNMWTK